MSKLKNRTEEKTQALQLRQKPQQFVHLARVLLMVLVVLLVLLLAALLVQHSAHGGEYITQGIAAFNTK